MINPIITVIAPRHFTKYIVLEVDKNKKGKKEKINGWSNPELS